MSPVLRPHFLTSRDYTALAKAAEIDCSRPSTRVEQMALATPALLARMQLLPAERMLAAVEPGYSFCSVTGLAATPICTTDRCTSRIIVLTRHRACFTATRWPISTTKLLR